MELINDTSSQENCLNDSILELQKVNKQLSKLALKKEELTANIIAAFSHEHEGQKSYEYNLWKIEIKTPFIYSLDKKKYTSGNFVLPEQYNPIKESISYSIDKRLCDQYMIDAPKKIRESLIQLIDKKAGKAGVTIKDRF